MFDPSKFEQLRELVDNDRTELLSLVEEYASNSATLLGQLREGIHHRRAQEASRAAHTLKSSSALMGASALASLCEQIESMTRRGEMPDDLPQRFTAVETGLDEAIRWLRGQVG